MSSTGDELPILVIIGGWVGWAALALLGGIAALLWRYRLQRRTRVRRLVLGLPRKSFDGVEEGATITIEGTLQGESTLLYDVDALAVTIVPAGVHESRTTSLILEGGEEVRLEDRLQVLVGGFERLRFQGEERYLRPGDRVVIRGRAMRRRVTGAGDDYRSQPVEWMLTGAGDNPVLEAAALSTKLRATPRLVLPAMVTTSVALIAVYAFGEHATDWELHDSRMERVQIHDGYFEGYFEPGDHETWLAVAAATPFHREEALYRLADYYEHLSTSEPTVARYAAARALNGQDVFLVSNLVDRGAYDLARDHAARIDPENDRSGLAEAYCKMGDLARASELMPREPSAQYEAGLWSSIALLAGHPEEAAEWAEQRIAFYDELERENPWRPEGAEPPFVAERRESRCLMYAIRARLGNEEARGELRELAETDNVQCKILFADLLEAQARIDLLASAEYLPEIGEYLGLETAVLDGLPLPFEVSVNTMRLSLVAFDDRLLPAGENVAPLMAAKVHMRRARRASVEGDNERFDTHAAMSARLLESLPQQDDLQESLRDLENRAAIDRGERTDAGREWPRLGYLDQGARDALEEQSPRAFRNVLVAQAQPSADPVEPRLWMRLLGESNMQEVHWAMRYRRRTTLLQYCNPLELYEDHVGGGRPRSPVR